MTGNRSRKLAFGLGGLVVGLGAVRLAAPRMFHRGSRSIEARARITVHKEPGDVYAAWRKLEQLPRFMTHLESVRPVGDGTTRWRATAPAGTEVEWDAEITGEQVGELLEWHSVGDSAVRNSGRVEFRPAPGDRGTEVRVRLEYEPPAGRTGAALAKLFGENPDQQLRDELRRFKQFLETGDVMRSDAAPEGAQAPALLTDRPAQPTN